MVRRNDEGEAQRRRWTFYEAIRIQESEWEHRRRGLRTQPDFAAVSIAANIAEGFKKRGKADKLRYFNMAQGPVEESRYYLILAEDLQYGDVDELRGLLEEVSKLLEAYSRAILNSDS